MWWVACGVNCLWLGLLSLVLNVDNYVLILYEIVCLRIFKAVINCI